VILAGPALKTADNRDGYARQMACKPGSVPATGEPAAIDGHSSATPVARRLVQPTRTATRKQAIRHPYSVLLPVGFTVPRLLPAARCALTAPFHPYLHEKAVCFLWHFPWGHPRRTLSGTVLPWSPDFPPVCKQTSGHPAI